MTAEVVNGARVAVPTVAGAYLLPATVDLPTAATYFGIGRDAAYAAAKRGDFPCMVLTIGRRLVVTRAALLSILDPDGAGRP